MIKKITALLTTIVMCTLLLPVSAFAVVKTPITVRANKEEANEGDIITYSVSYGAIQQGLGSSEFSLVIPDGLTYIEGSYSVTENLSTILGADKAAYTESPNKKFISYGATGIGYVSNDELQIMTFQCKVNDNASIGDKVVTVDVADFSDNDFDDIPYNVVPAVVKITKKPVAATGVELSQTSANMKSGESIDLVATLKPENTTDTIKEWKSSNTKVATVKDGKVTAVGEGKATITVVTSNNLEAKCEITVTCSHSDKNEVVAKQPTCIEDGNNKYYVCKDCGKIFKADGITETTIEAETIKALGHDFSVDQKDDNYHWKKCSRCEETSEKVAHNGDTWKNDETHHWKVCGCGIVIEKAEHIKGEKVTENVVPANCQHAGSHDEVVYCTVCKKELSRTNVIDSKTDHQADEPVRENEVQATCGKEGSYDEVIYCKTCHSEISREAKVIEKLPHDVSNVSWSYDNTKHWKECGCGTKVDEASHKPGEIVKENIVAPTCTKDGKHDEVTYCEVCGYEINRTKDVVDKAVGHTPGEAVKENVVDPTCTKEGKYDEVVYCEVCHEELSRKTKTTEKTAHTPGEPVQENVVKPTVDKEGSYDEVIYCQKCEKELSRESKVTPKFVYEMLEVPSEPHNEKTEGTLTFRVNGEFEKFTGLKVDDKEVDKSNYTVKSGSTIVTLNADYLNTLGTGTHTISFMYDDGEISANFKVAEAPATNQSTSENASTNTTNKTTKSSNSVNTADNSHMPLWILGLTISGILFVTVLKCAGKRRKTKH